MSAPFIFIATNRLKPGKLEAERARIGELADYIAEAEPGLVAFNEFADQNGAEVGVVQLHSDVASMQFHIGVIRERAAQAYAETLDATTTIQVFGRPDEAMLRMLREQAGSGVEITIKPQFLGGFTRSAAAG